MCQRPSTSSKVSPLCQHEPRDVVSCGSPLFADARVVAAPDPLEKNFGGRRPKSCSSLRFSRRQTTKSELKELRRIRGRSKVLESKVKTPPLQRRATARDRATEWEQRASEDTAALREADTSLKTPMIARHCSRPNSLAQIQLQEKYAEDQLAKVIVSYQPALCNN